jgi:hypothetical protein
MMYKEEEAEARVVQMSPILRGLAEEMLRRGKQFEFDHRVPLDEALDSDLEEQIRLALSEPALKQEWEEFWQALSDAAEEDIEAIRRGEHDHELQVSKRSWAGILRGPGLYRALPHPKALSAPQLGDGRPSV